MGVPNAKSQIIRLKGLDPDKKYLVAVKKPGLDQSEEIEKPDREDGSAPEETAFSGDSLMNAGLVLPKLWGDFKAIWIEIVSLG
ncbi:MAG: GH36 C-terminal domain-containing protein [Eubacterium sp.]|nr:GH36 C-terminal domain-containing protein [Eubacterium sp.]